MGAKRSKIYDYLLSCGQNVVKRDVDNMVQRARMATSTLDDDDETAAVVAEFASANENNAVTVDVTDRNETGVVSLTSKYMRDLYTRFPEVLLVDTTHKTNRYNYQLLTLMVMDERGNGQPVQHSVMETNSEWHMHRAINHFKRANPNRWKLLSVIMVDKDLNEIRILEGHFPEARVLLCHFHVIKYLSVMCRKPEFGKFSQDDLASIDALVHGMVYADSAEQYVEKWEWTAAATTLPKIRTFEYNAYEVTPDDIPALAEFSDEEEFKKHEAIVNIQWRNFRQAKRRRVKDEVIETTDDTEREPALEVSQPHSLYDAAIGPVPDFDPSMTTFRQIEGHLLASQSQPAAEAPLLTSQQLEPQVEPGSDEMKALAPGDPGDLEMKATEPGTNQSDEVSACVDKPEGLNLVAPMMSPGLTSSRTKHLR
ncbi:hypothetical protein P43SY_011695 [Pythium insidiosum]|uniref:ZSWIM1/3 RNaseH-like domain-containing protein n=1 Tax=Pythium insidiosum TaxID=114742 RepID=A0AAD5L7S5_PYTIN|nr:hypothetical protein P43SY_011695 [Pythium insidiosum]